MKPHVLSDRILAIEDRSTIVWPTTHTSAACRSSSSLKRRPEATPQSRIWKYSGVAPPAFVVRLFEPYTAPVGRAAAGETRATSCACRRMASTSPAVKRANALGGGVHPFGDARHDEEHVASEPGDRLADVRRGPLAHHLHHDHGPDADDDSEHREERAHLVPQERREGELRRRADHHAAPLTSCGPSATTRPSLNTIFRFA